MRSGRGILRLVRFRRLGCQRRAEPRSNRFFCGCGALRRPVALASDDPLVGLQRPVLHERGRHLRGADRRFERRYAHADLLAVRFGFVLVDSDCVVHACHGWGTHLGSTVSVSDEPNVRQIRGRCAFFRHGSPRCRSVCDRGSVDGRQERNRTRSVPAHNGRCAADSDDHRVDDVQRGSDIHGCAVPVRADRADRIGRRRAA